MVDIKLVIIQFVSLHHHMVVIIKDSSGYKDVQLSQLGINLCANVTAFEDDTIHLSLEVTKGETL